MSRRYQYLSAHAADGTIAEVRCGQVGLHLDKTMTNRPPGPARRQDQCNQTGDAAVRELEELVTLMGDAKVKQSFDRPPAACNTRAYSYNVSSTRS